MVNKMSVNGVDIAQEVGAICGSAWIVLYIALIWFVWTRKPKTLVGRRWKASWVIGGLPILAMPFIMPFIIFGILILQSDSSKFDVPKLLENIPLIFSSILGLIACTAPISVLVATIAILGTYQQFRTFLDMWVDKIVPPSKDEKPSATIWD